MLQHEVCDGCGEPLTFVDEFNDDGSISIVGRCFNPDCERR